MKNPNFQPPKTPPRDTNALPKPRQRKMILTNCAACAAPLAHDAPRCVRCQTRYCNATCQHDHWRRGHKQICKEIHRAGGAEQYHANKKYKEAVAVAVDWADASIERNGRRHVALRIDRAARLEFGRSRAQRLRKIMSRVFLGTPAAPPLTSG